jgi:hypothetical protein
MSISAPPAVVLAFPNTAIALSRNSRKTNEDPGLKATLLEPNFQRVKTLCSLRKCYLQL